MEGDFDICQLLLLCLLIIFFISNFVRSSIFHRTGHLRLSIVTFPDVYSNYLCYLGILGREKKSNIKSYERSETQNGNLFALKIEIICNYYQEVFARIVMESLADSIIKCVRLLIICSSTVTFSSAEPGHGLNGPKFPEVYRIQIFLFLK